MWALADDYRISRPKRHESDALYGGYAGATLIEIDDDVRKEY